MFLFLVSFSFLPFFFFSWLEWFFVVYLLIYLCISYPQMYSSSQVREPTGTMQCLHMELDLVTPSLLFELKGFVVVVIIFNSSWNHLSTPCLSSQSKWRHTTGIIPCLEWEAMRCFGSIILTYIKLKYRDILKYFTIRLSRITIPHEESLWAVRTNTVGHF